MLVMKCSRLLRFASRPSVKLLKAVIGIRVPIGCQLLWLRVRLGSLFLGSRWRGRGKVGIPNIGFDLPCPVSLFFEDLYILAAVLDWLAAGVSHCLFVGAAHVREIAGFRYFNLGRLPTDASARTGQHLFPSAPNCLPCHCR